MVGVLTWPVLYFTNYTKIIVIMSEGRVNGLLYREILVDNRLKKESMIGPAGINVVLNTLCLLLSIIVSVFKTGISQGSVLGRPMIIFQIKININIYVR